jgi:hypothetical protein
MESPKVFEFAESPAPAAVEKLVSEMQMAGYDTVHVYFVKGDEFVLTLTRFLEMRFSNSIKQLTFRQRKPGK